MGVKLGPAGVPLSCKGRTIVEGMDDIIALGLETMEAQTVRLIQPQHFEQYWQAGVLANKAEFEMNIHGPYYSELLGNRVERGRSLAKIEATLQAARTINARHITLHTGHYGDFGRGSAANEQVAKMNFLSSLGSKMEHLPKSELRHQDAKSCGEVSKKSSKSSTTLRGRFPFSTLPTFTHVAMDE